jgi:O-antigen/teichoic acid export membrane protein
MAESTPVDREPRESRPTPLARPARILYLHGYALVMSSAITSGLGLVFWVAATRMYDTDAVGRNSALLYSMMFLVGIAQVQLPNALVRFLPVAGRQQRMFVVAAYAAGTALAAGGAVVFVLGASVWSPQLVPDLQADHNAWLFVAATGIWALFVMQDSVLTGLGRAGLVPLENLGFSVLKLVLLVAWAAVLPEAGMFAAWAVATVVFVLATNVYLFLGPLRAVRPIPEHDLGSGEPNPLQAVARFVGGDYLGAVLWLTCTTALPVVVFDIVGPDDSAVYSVVWTICYSLYLVPSAMGQSLVAHTAADPSRLAEAARGVLRHSLLLVVPAVLVLVLAAPLVLRFFGEEYAEDGVWVMRLAALSAVPNVLNSVAVSVARVRRRMTHVVGILGALSVTILGMCLLLLPGHGIGWVGLSWLVGQSVVAVVVLATGLWPRRAR